jgi:hypothetical protein
VTADQLVERGADRLVELSEHASRRGGVAAKLADPLAQDAEFLRKLKPSLIKARAKGNAPTDSQPEEPRHAPSGPQLHSRPESPKQKPAKRKSGGGGGGPNPFLVAGAALAAGILLAKWLDWRGHAHPRG